MKFNAEASLHLDNRTSNVEIRISDSASRGQILTLSLTPKQFASLMANRMVSDIEADIDPAVKHVGRERVNTHAVIRVLGGAGEYGLRDKLKAYIKGLGHIQGWTLSTYLGSQDSLTSKGQDLIVRVAAFKFLPRGTADSSKPPTLSTTVRIQDVKSKSTQAESMQLLRRSRGR